MTAAVSPSPAVGKQADGFIVSDDLLPQKARILLMLALSMSRDRHTIQELFYQY